VIDHHWQLAKDPIILSHPPARNPARNLPHSLPISMLYCPSILLSFKCHPRHLQLGCGWQKTTGREIWKNHRTITWTLRYCGCQVEQQQKWSAIERNGENGFTVLSLTGRRLWMTGWKMMSIQWKPQGEVLWVILEDSRDSGRQRRRGSPAKRASLNASRGYSNWSRWHGNGPGYVSSFWWFGWLGPS